MNEVKHVCNGYCVCPIHKTPMYYAPSHDKHACQDRKCEYAHGIEKSILYAYRNRILNNLPD